MDDGLSSLAEDSDMLAVFLEEASDQLQTLSTGLVQLEQEPGNTEVIQSVFRVAHTLKSSSAMMGLLSVSDLTHAMEDVLDEVRNGKLLITSAVIDLLLRGLDLLTSIVTAIEAGTAHDSWDAEVAELSSELREVARGTPEVADAGPLTSNSVAPAADAAQKSEAVVAVLVQFLAACQLPEIRAAFVLRGLGECGEVLRSSPDLALPECEMPGKRLLVVLASAMADDVLTQAVLQAGEVDWVRIERGEAASELRADTPGLTAPACAPAQVSTAQAKGPTPIPAQTPTQVAASAPHTVRVRVDTLDHLMNLVGELVLDRTRLAQLIETLHARRVDEGVLQDLDLVAHHLGSVVSDIHEDVLQARMLPIRDLFRRFPRLVRDLSQSLGKQADLEVSGEEELLDRSVIEKLVDPLTHILRNSLDHGMESPADREEKGKPARGTIRLAAWRSESHVLIEVSDDGPGINGDRLKEKAVEAGTLSQTQASVMSQREAYALIFVPGLSSARAVSDVSGRGVGMDVVKKGIESLGGTVQVESEPGVGTSVLLTIPLTLAIIRALVVQVGQVEFALPLATVEETISISRSSIKSVRGRGVLPWRGHVVPVIPLADVFPGCGEARMGATVPLVAVRYGTQDACLAVDSILGHQEIVVKSLGAFMGNVPGLAGATILGSGRVALIIDLGRVFDDGMLRQPDIDAMAIPQE